jgi:hypothetical protein
VREGEAQRILRLPWGVGACFRQTPTGRSTGPPGIFFAIRTPPSLGEPDGRRYWRYVELAPGELETNDLESLRRIDPTGGHPVSDAIGDVDLEAAWQRAAAEVVEEHNRRADVREEQEAIGPVNAGLSTSCAIRASRTPLAPRKPRKPRRPYRLAAAPPCAEHPARSRPAFTSAT